MELFNDSRKCKENQQDADVCCNLSNVYLDNEKRKKENKRNTLARFLTVKIAACVYFDEENGKQYSKGNRLPNIYVCLS